MTPLLGELRTTFGANCDPEVESGRFTVDGIEPQAVLRPDSPEAAARCVDWIHTRSHTLIPHGAGTTMEVGNIPGKYEVAMSLERINRIIEYTPEDMTITVGAGLTLAELQRQLAEHGQFLPIEALPQATIGGIIASNVYGSSRLAWGLVRDWLIGVRFVRSDGKLVHAGGKVVKNVAGYDLCKLLVGSFGTLGVIVEATFKVAPLPAASFCCVTDWERLPEINASPVRPRFVELLNSSACRELGIEPRGDATLLVGVSGTREEVEWQAAQLADPRIEFDPASLARFGRNEPVLLRLVGKPSEFNQLHALVAESFPVRCILAAHVNLGVIRCAVAASPTLPDLVQCFRRQYQVRIERAPVELKRSVDVWGDPGPSLSLMKALKQEFDPRGVFSPGRFAGGI